METSKTQKILFKYLLQFSADFSETYLMVCSYGDLTINQFLKKLKRKEVLNMKSIIFSGRILLCHALACQELLLSINFPNYLNRRFCVDYVY